MHIVHVYREANQLSDYIENTAIQKENTQQYLSFTQLPSFARRILNIDKQHIPKLRIKTMKISGKSRNVQV